MYKVIARLYNLMIFVVLSANINYLDNYDALYCDVLEGQTKSVVSTEVIVGISLLTSLSKFLTLKGVYY